MSNVMNFNKSLLGNLKKGFQDNSISARYENLFDSALGVNLSSESASLARETRQTVDSLVDQSISLLLAQEDFKDMVITEAQRAAGRIAASIASNPKKYAQRISNLNDTVTYGNNVTKFSDSSMGVEDFADLEVISGEISNEAYDGQKLNNAVYFSIAYNVGATRQDEFAEAFFPTITIDPAQSGINISIDCATVFNEYTRLTSGEQKRGQFTRTPVVKSIFDEQLFASDRHRLVPVLRDSDAANKAQFLDSAKYVENVSGTEITTAPLLFGRTVDIIGISQTDDMVAKGVADNTDALDRTINLKKVFFEIESDASAGDQEVQVFDTSIYAGHNFVANPQSHHKELILNFNTNVVLNLSNAKKADGSESTIWNNIVTTGSYNDYKAIFDVQITGQANTFDGTIELNASKMQLVEVRNASGQVLATSDAAYIAIAKAANTVKPKGYVVEASRTNSNIRTRGVLITNDRYEYIYNVPFRSGITALYPVASVNGDDNDANTVSNQILLAGVIISNSAVKKLDDYASAMNEAAASGVIGIGDYASGIASRLVDPYFFTQSFELASAVDSLNSATRLEDIRAALLNIIKNECINAYLKSNYGVAHDVVRGNVGGKVAVIIGTDPMIKSLLVKDDDVFAIDSTFEAHVVATKNPKVSGRIFITFGVFDANRNSAPNPLNFGNNVWAPTISYEVTKTTNNSVSRELHNNPRFLHIIHLPVLTVINVTDVAEVFKKIPQQQKVVS